MLGYLNSNLILGAAFCLSIEVLLDTNVDAAEENNDRCQHSKCPLSYGTFADIEDCSKYYICNNGYPEQQSCPSGLLFDKFLKACQSVDYANCDDGSDYSFKCPTFMGIYPKPNDCSKYYNCIHYNPFPYACENGRLFDDATKQCRSDGEVNCGTRDRLTNRCNNYTRDKEFKCPSSYGTFADYEDCSKYYICNNGNPGRQSCPSGLLFDKYLKACQGLDYAACDDGSDYTFKCPTFNGIYANPNDCSRFYNCIVYNPFSSACDKDRLFDDEKKYCRPAGAVNCGSRNRPTT